MEVVGAAAVTAAGGVEPDFRGRPGPRQVTVLSVESWAAVCSTVGSEVPWTVRRANLLIEGIDLAQSAGSRLRVGAATLEITGETAPCGRMEEQVPGLRGALEPDWRGGIRCRVVEEGEVRVGDAVELTKS